LPITLVSGASKMQDAGSVTMSVETDRVGGVAQVAAVGAPSTIGVDLVDRGLPPGLEGEVGGRAGRDRDAQRVAVELALELGHDQADRLGGTGRRRAPR
jgi:hypothetical protein